jgi:transposase InsO family protein
MYVPTWSGMVYVAFVFDVHSRRILGWRAATSMRTDLVLDCLEMAMWTRRTEGVVDLSGLVHHTDAGSQYTSIAFTDRLLECGIDASVGSVGDAYDNALAESQIGLYKTELINPGGPWTGRDQVEARDPRVGAPIQHRTYPRFHRRSDPDRGGGRSTTLTTRPKQKPLEALNRVSGHAAATHPVPLAHDRRGAGADGHRCPS